MNIDSPMTAIVLAGDRRMPDPVARAAGVPAKALAPVAGVPMVLRVLGTLAKVPGIGERVLCGPAWSAVESNRDLRDVIATGQVRWIEPGATPSASAAAAMQTVPESRPVLLTTADHALLRAEIVEHLCSQARARACDVVVGLAPSELVTKAYPETRRTIVRLRGGGVCGCNLYVFLTARGRALAAFWRQVERQRKNPLGLIGTLGWGSVLAYLLGRLSLDEGLARLSSRLQISIEAVMLPFPEAAVDVDKVVDWELAQRLAGAPSPGPGVTRC